MQDESGKLVGRKHNNLILNLWTYQVQFPDGEVTEYTANVITENMISQCDPDNNQFLLMKVTTDHCKDQTAVTDADRYVIVKGTQYPHKTTKGWQMCVTWQDGTMSCEQLSDLKESFPMETTEYAMAKGIGNEPTFFGGLTSS